MKKSALLFCLFLVGMLHVQGQSLYSNAEAAAMGYSTSAMQSVWAVFHNPAGTAQITEWTIGSSINSQISSRNPYDMLVYSAFVVAPTKNGNFHFVHNGSRFEDDSRNGESNLFGIGYAHRIGNKLRLGVQYSYLATYIEGFHPSKRYDQHLKLSGQYDLLEKLTVGLTLNGTKRTITHPKESTYPGAWPTIGAEYRFNSRLLLRADFLGEGGGPVSIGGQYRTFDNLYMRAGVVTGAFGPKIHGGIGVKHEKYQLDISVSPIHYYDYGAVINISGAFKF